MASRAVPPRTKPPVSKTDAEWRAGLRRGLRRLAQMTGAGLLLGATIFLALALVSYTQTLATDQGWAVDWAGVAAWRAQADERLKAGQLRDALGAFGEVISLLGEAGRQFRQLQIAEGRT